MNKAEFDYYSGKQKAGMNGRRDWRSVSEGKKREEDERRRNREGNCNEMKNKDKILVETPCVITNKTAEGKVIQTPAVFTQRFEVEKARPSHLSDNPRSLTETDFIPSER